MLVLQRLLAVRAFVDLLVGVLQLEVEPQLAFVEEFFAATVTLKLGSICVTAQV